MVESRWVVLAIGPQEAIQYDDGSRMRVRVHDCVPGMSQGPYSKRHWKTAKLLVSISVAQSH